MQLMWRAQVVLLILSVLQSHVEHMSRTWQKASTLYGMVSIDKQSV